LLNFYFKTILLTNNFYGKKLSAFDSIYLLASIMYICNLFGGNSYRFLLYVVFSVFGVQHDFLCTILQGEAK